MLGTVFAIFCELSFLIFFQGCNDYYQPDAIVEIKTNVDNTADTLFPIMVILLGFMIQQVVYKCLHHILPDCFPG